MTSKAPLIYLTYGDVDSPIYRSQVVGFCDFLEQELEIETQIIAFVPFRLLFQQRKKMAKYNYHLLV